MTPTSGLLVRLRSGTVCPLLPVELIHIEARTRSTVILREGTTQLVPRDPGTYAVQTVTPDGDVLSQQVVVAPDAVTEVELGPANQIEPDPNPTGTTGGWWTPTDGSYCRAGGTPQAVDSRMWCGLWAFDAARWRPTSWPDRTVLKVRAGRTYLDLRLPAGYLHAITIGGPTDPGSVTILPPAAQVVLAVRRTADGHFAVKACSDHDRAESLLAYLTHGQLVAATAIAYADHTTEELGTDPVDGVVEGLYLARTGGLRLDRRWPATLADRYAWLPDAAAIRVSQLLAQSPVPRAELRSRLLAAAAAGVPVYAASVGLLRRGLVLLSGEAPDDEELSAAHEHIQRYATTRDWSASLCTFGGSSPDVPTFEQILLPERPPGWVELPSPLVHRDDADSAGSADPADPTAALASVVPFAASQIRTVSLHSAFAAAAAEADVRMRTVRHSDGPLTLEVVIDSDGSMAIYGLIRPARAAAGTVATEGGFLGIGLAGADAAGSASLWLYFRPVGERLEARIDVDAPPDPASLRVEDALPRAAEALVADAHHLADSYRAMANNHLGRRSWHRLAGRLPSSSPVVRAIELAKDHPR